MVSKVWNQCIFDMNLAHQELEFWRSAKLALAVKDHAVQWHDELRGRCLIGAA